MKLYKALDLLLIEKEKTLKPNSYNTLLHRTKRMKELIKDDEIEKIDIQSYIYSWTFFSLKSLKIYAGLYKQLCTFCGINRPNIFYPKRSKTKKDYYSNEEINKIETYLINNKLQRQQLGVPIALYTGCRMGEILGLQWKDIDLDKGTLEVNKNVVFISHKGKIIQTPKTESSYRKIPIPKQLVDILLEFKPLEKDYNTFVTSKSGGGEPQCPRSFQWVCYRLLNKIGVKPKGLHAFRHSFTCRLLENNIQPKIASDLLGHSSTRITMDVYAHTSEDLKKQTINQVYDTTNENSKTILQEINEIELALRKLKERIMRNE